MNKKGQTTLEITVLLILTVAAFLAMFGYFKGSLQGNWKTNADSFSNEQIDDFSAKQSKVYDSGVIFSGSSVGFDFNNDHLPDTNLGNITTPATKNNQIKQVQGWGTY